jgi:hypothetical protein
MVRGTGIEPVIHIADLLVVNPKYTDLASRDAVAKLRLDAAPTPRSRVARMTKRPVPTGAGQEAKNAELHKIDHSHIPPLRVADRYTHGRRNPK